MPDIVVGWYPEQFCPPSPRIGLIVALKNHSHDRYHFAPDATPEGVLLSRNKNWGFGGGRLPRNCSERGSSKDFLPRAHTWLVHSIVSMNSKLMRNISYR